MNLLKSQETYLNIKQYLIRSLCGITALKKLNLGIKKTGNGCADVLSKSALQSTIHSSYIIYVHPIFLSIIS